MFHFSLRLGTKTTCSGLSVFLFLAFMAFIDATVQRADRKRDERGGMTCSMGPHVSSCHSFILTLLLAFKRGKKGKHWPDQDVYHWRPWCSYSWIESTKVPQSCFKKNGNQSPSAFILQIDIYMHPKRCTELLYLIQTFKMAFFFFFFFFFSKSIFFFFKVWQTKYSCTQCCSVRN